MNRKNIRPFRMLEHIYFVGGREVSVHIIDSGEGLIMIDTGYPYMEQLIENNMREVGLDIRDLKIILHSHAHYDHIGSTARFKALSGAKTYISRIDNEITNGNRDLSMAVELGHDRVPEFECDVLLEDGDIVELGNIRIRCVLCPGHTEGTLAFLFETEDRGRKLMCAMHGGVGTNSMEREFLEKYGLSITLRDEFRNGLHRLSKEHVDVVLGNHPDQNDTEAKLERLDEGDRNAFIDPSEWQTFMKVCETRLDKLIDEESIR